MDKAKKSPCWKVFVGACCLIFGGQGLIANSIGMYITPLCYVTGSGVGTISIGMSVMALAMMIVLIFVGKVLGKFPLRPVLISTTIVTMGAFIIMGYVDSLPILYVLFAIMGAAQAIPVYVIGPTLVTNWFEAKKGTLTSIMLLFGNLGGIVGSLGAGMLLGAEPYNTHLAFTVMGGAAMIIMLVGAFTSIMHPALVGCKPYGSEDEPSTGETAVEGAPVAKEIAGISAAKALKSIPFYCLFIMLFALIFCASFTSLLGNFTVSLGFPNTQAGVVTSVFQVAAAIGTITWGVLDDKIGVKKTSLIAFSILMVGVLGLAFLAQSSFTLLLGCTFLFGLGGSATGLQYPILTSKFFGQKEYSSILSKIQIAQSVSGLISIPVIGFVAQITGSYTPALLFLAVFVIVAMFAVVIGVSSAKKLLLAEGIEPPKM